MGESETETNQEEEPLTHSPISTGYLDPEIWFKLILGYRKVSLLCCRELDKHTMNLLAPVFMPPSARNNRYKVAPP